MFSKKHYEFLASFLAYERSMSSGIYDRARLNVIDGIARLLARRLAERDTKFNRAQFLEACGNVKDVL